MPEAARGEEQEGVMDGQRGFSSGGVEANLNQEASGAMKATVGSSSSGPGIDTPEEGGSSGSSRTQGRPVTPKPQEVVEAPKDRPQVPSVDGSAERGRIVNGPDSIGCLFRNVEIVDAIEEGQEVSSPKEQQQNDSFQGQQIDSFEEQDQVAGLKGLKPVVRLDKNAETGQLVTGLQDVTVESSGSDTRVDTPGEGQQIDPLKDQQQVASPKDNLDTSEDRQAVETPEKQRQFVTCGKQQETTPRHQRQLVTLGLHQHIGISQNQEQQDIAPEDMQQDITPDEQQQINPPEQQQQPVPAENEGVEPVPVSRFLELVTKLPSRIDPGILEQMSFRERNTKQIRNRHDYTALIRVMDWSALNFLAEMHDRNEQRLQDDIWSHFGMGQDFFESFKRYLIHRGMWLLRRTGEERRSVSDIGKGFVVLFVLRTRLPEPYQGSGPGTFDEFRRGKVMEVNGADKLLVLANTLMKLYLGMLFKRESDPPDSLDWFLRQTSDRTLLDYHIDDANLRDWYSKALHFGLECLENPPFEWRKGVKFPKYPLTSLHCRDTLDEERNARYKGICSFEQLGKLLSSPKILTMPEVLGEWAFCVET